MTIGVPGALPDPTLEVAIAGVPAFFSGRGRDKASRELTVAVRTIPTTTYRVPVIEKVSLVAGVTGPPGEFDTEGVGFPARRWVPTAPVFTFRALFYRANGRTATQCFDLPLSHYSVGTRIDMEGPKWDEVCRRLWRLD